MTTTDQATTDRRTGYIAGLRALADFFERTPDLPVPLGAARASIYVDAADFAAAVSTLGGQRTKKVEDQLFKVERQIGGATVVLIAMRDQVCEAKVVGTEKIMVPDPAAPMVEVERDVVEWDCKPVLA